MKVGLGQLGEIHVHRVILIAILLLSLPMFSLASDNSELRSIKDADQADRAAGRSINWAEVSKRDAQRRVRVLELLKSGGLSTAWDYFNAALVLQHGQTIEDIRLAHSLATVAATVDPTHPSAKWLMAASWDRLMDRFKQPQWYGTQFTEDASGRTVLVPVNPDAVTDADRLALGVPPLAEAQARADARNKGK